MTLEIIKCLCDLDISNQIQSGELIEDWYKRLSDVVIDIAKLPNTSQETLILLAKDSNENVRCNVARHINTSDEILALLAIDYDDRVCY